MRLGIDFGTTRTVVAAADRGNYPVVSFEGPDGEVVDHWPSIVATDGRALLFGPHAVARLGDPGIVAVRSIKRLLTSGRPDVEVALGPVRLTVRDLLVGCLRALREDLVERSNAPGASSGSRIDAWVGVPAGAGTGQRLLTLAAFDEAGFVVAGLLNEPSAAGLEYAHRFRKTVTASRDDVLVYDLGGGTFDASLVRVGGRAHEVRAHAGDTHLGGDDFDEILLAQAQAAAAISPADLDAGMRTRLLEHCRLAKEALRATSRKVVLELPTGVGEGATVTLPVSAYYEACEPLVERTLDAVARILPPGEGERFDLDRLAGVYVVGGASELPLVARRLKEVFGRRVKRSAYASASTAVGLAIALDEGATLSTERFSRAFGVFRETESGVKAAFDAILSPEDAIGPSGGERRRRYRAAHNIGCFRYAECARLDGAEAVGDLLPWGTVRFPFRRDLQGRDDLASVPVERLGAPGPLVEERYTVEPSGAVRVSFTDLETGFTREHHLGASG